MKPIYHIPPNILRTSRTVDVEKIDDEWHVWSKHLILIDGHAQSAMDEMKVAIAGMATTAQINVSDDRIVISGYTRITDEYALERLENYLANVEEYKKERSKAIHDIAVLLHRFPEILLDKKYELDNERYSVATYSAIASSLSGARKSDKTE